MKKLKVIIFLIIALLCVGCTKNKVALSGSEFLDKMNDMKYKVHDYSDTIDYAISAYSLSDKDIELTYIEGKRRYDIEGLFIDECKNVLTQAGENAKKSTKGGEKWTSMTVTTDDAYYYVSWIERTYIYVKTDLKHKTEVENIMKELGY